MGHYILIVFMSFHVLEGGATSQHIEFTNKWACEQARAKVIDAFNKPSNNAGSWGRRDILVVCTEKG